MTPLMVFLLTVFCSALSYLVIAAYLKGPKIGAIILGATFAVVLMPVVAYAGGGGTISTGDSPKELLGYGIGIAVAAGLSWIGKHVVALLKSTKAGKDTLDAAHQLGIDERLAELAMNYADQETSKLAHRLSDTQIMGKALDFVKDRGLDAAGILRIAKTIEAKIAMRKAQKKLSDAATKFEAALPDLQAKIDSFPKATPPTHAPKQLTPVAGEVSSK